jgi:DNA replication protein DnaC
VEPPRTYLKRAYSAHPSLPLTTQAAQHAWSHVASLAKLLEGEVEVRRDRTTKSRLRLARFPVIQTLEPFRWAWPPRRTRLQGHNHFHLEFIKAKANLLFLGGVGRGKTPLATALGEAACLKGYSVLFASALEVSTTRAAAKNAGRLKTELKKYTQPALFRLDELGYLPIDKTGAERLCQVISLRYEQGAIVMTSNRAGKECPKIFNTDSPLTAAILERLLHHAETVIIEGQSCRMKDRIEG